MTINTQNGRFGSVISISTANVLAGKTPEISGTANVGEFATDLTDFDHSLSVTRASTFSVSFGQVSNVDYIMISGHNAFNGRTGVDAANVEVYDGQTLVVFQYITENRNIFISSPISSYANLRIIIRNNLIGDPKPITVSMIAAGPAITYTMPESHNYLTKGTKYISKTDVNGMAAPVSMLRQLKEQSGSFSAQNLSPDDLTNKWQKVFDMADNVGYVIMNESSASDHKNNAVLAYDNDFSLSSHPSSMNYWSMSWKFKAFTGY